MSKNKSTKEYIGDGVYCEFDGFGYTLTSENGIEILDTIYLELQTLEQLFKYIDNLKPEEYCEEYRLPS